MSRASIGDWLVGRILLTFEVQGVRIVKGLRLFSIITCQTSIKDLNGVQSLKFQLVISKFRSLQSIACPIIELLSVKGWCASIPGLLKPILNHVIKFSFIESIEFLILFNLKRIPNQAVQTSDSLFKAIAY